MRCVNASFLGIIIVLLFALDPRGRAWMAGIKEAGKSLKFLDEPSNHEDACKNSDSSETVGHEVAGAMVRRMPQPEKVVNWEDQGSYSISCSLILHQEKYYAACPF